MSTRPGDKRGIIYVQGEKVVDIIPPDPIGELGSGQVDRVTPLTVSK